MLEIPLEKLPVGIIVVEAETLEVHTANEAAARILNREKSNLINSSFKKLLGKQTDLDTVKDILKTPEKYLDETLLLNFSVNKKNKRISVSCTVYTEKDSTYLVFSLHDNCENCPVREDIEKFETMIENSGEEIFLVEPDGKIVYCNQAAADSLACGREELLTLKVSDIDSKFKKDCDFLQRFEQLKKKKSPPFVRTHTGKDGREVTKEIQSVYLTIGDNEYICAFARDISAKQRRKKMLEQSRRMLRLVLDSIPVRVFWKDCDSVYLGCNKAFAGDAGLKKPEYIKGKSDHDLPWGEFAEQYIKDDRQVIESRTPKLNYEEQELRGDGQIAWLRTSKIPLIDSDGETMGVMGIYEDISEQKKIMQRLEKSLQEKEVLFKEVHHRVKNNLFTIVSLLEMQQMMAEDPRLAEQLSQSIRRIHSMALIHKMVYQAEDFEEISFADYIRQLTQTLMESLTLPGQKIETDYNLTPETMHLDQALPCALIINELLSNAFKHGFKNKKDGKLKISYASDENNYVINIANNGHRLAEKFDIHNSSSLGLKLVNSLAEKQLSGKIFVKNNGMVNFGLKFPRQITD
ncbi:MAG: PAS domain S-box protein [bacterium]